MTAQPAAAYRPTRIFSHVTVGTHDVKRAAAFYDAVLAPLGLERMTLTDQWVSYREPDNADPRNIPFTAMRPFDGRPASWGNGTHVAFLAPNHAAVEAFHAAGLAHGGTCEGPPGPRPDFHAAYYAAFVRDPDGNKLQAVCHDPQ